MTKQDNPALISIASQEHYVDAELYEYEYRRRRADVRHYVALATSELPAGAEILDLCCGSGRVARALLRAGFVVTGLDQGEAMVERARLGVSRLPKRCRPNATFVRGDMRRFDLGRRFPLIISAFNSLEHLYSRDDIERALSAIKAHLEPGGLFAFDVQLPDLAWLQKDPDKRWARTKFRHPVSGQQLAYSTNHVYDQVTQVVWIRFYYEPLEDGPLKETAVVHLSQRKFYPAELQALLHHHGFEVLRHEADFDGETLDEFALSQTLVCRATRG